MRTRRSYTMVLEEGVGYVELLVIALRQPDGSITWNSGPVLSYYEFKHPMRDRLTDERWRELLEAGEAPAPPPWVH